MKDNNYNYDLPEELIAFYPALNRDSSKLMILKQDGKIIDSIFVNLDEFIEPDSLIVFNDSKVIKASIALFKDDREININLNKQVTGNIWQAFARPAKKLMSGDIFDFGGNKIIIKEKYDDGLVDIEFDLVKNMKLFDFLDIYGSVPLPPYIKRDIDDLTDEFDYQTIYSLHPGSVAAPTAGLHFSDEVFVKLKKKNIDFCFVTLHVGAGTFLPMKDSPENHTMHSEYGEISKESADMINNAKSQGRKIVAVGTTTVRTLENSALEDAKVKPCSFETDLFIKPGFEFKIVDQLITNFHQPKSTLLVLVSSFAGDENILNAYNHAKENGYRFLSYGDAMLLSKKNGV
ncbi:MAG: tRNA preQ1(34) S-adenosylmethionine ribosyltransferase-isomerase QueA [Rickettsiaceae bacterium]|nr:tRNA preQ1(34) S-adenosylmethionine ribosyltransferase-isomerase QueA [Rickettsiaceae bacterium]